MIISIDSTNPVKVNGVKKVFSYYEEFKNAEFTEYKTKSGVPEQPLTLLDTIRGAIARARNVFNTETHLSIGLESGIMHIPFTKSGYMNICMCSIFDGKEDHLGLSSGFEIPGIIAKLILRENLDGNVAMIKAGFTDNPRVGNNEGMLGILTKGKITRQDQIEQAIANALIYILFKK